MSSIIIVLLSFKHIERDVNIPEDDIDELVSIITPRTTYIFVKKTLAHYTTCGKFMIYIEYKECAYFIFYIICMYNIDSKIRIVFFGVSLLRGCRAGGHRVLVVIRYD